LTAKPLSLSRAANHCGFGRAVVMRSLFATQCSF
jgi:hypothetical protein